MSKVKIIPDLRFPEFENEGEWDKPKLSSVSDVIMGSSPSSLSYNENKIGLPLLQGNADIKNRLSTPRIYTTEITKECEIGDILLSVRAPVGTVAKSLHNACIGRGISALSAKKPNSQEYIYQWLFSYESSWAKISQGGTFDAVNSDDIKNLLVPIPKPKEQQKIASCLSSLDNLIAAHSQKLDLLKDHKKGLMQNLFPQEGETNPKYRFPDFTRPLSKVGFADLGDIKIGLTHKPDYISSGVPFLSSKNISGGFINFKNVQYISSEKFESMPESTKPKFGDILFTRVGSNLGNPIVLERKIEFGIFVSLGAFRVNKKANNIYIKYWMESDLFWKQVNQKVAGGAKDNLNSTWLREFELFIPLIEEQQKIASCLSSLDALITAQAEKIEQLKLHKKGLMQGMFPKIEI